MSLNYTENIDVLMALVTHLALTRRKSRTPANLASDLGFGGSDVERVLNGFPSLFRRSKNTSKETGEHFYTLHHRFALRTQEGGDDPAREPLSDAQLGTLVSFITAMENSERQWRALRVPVICAAIAAAAALFVAVLNLGAWQ